MPNRSPDLMLRGSNQGKTAIGDYKIKNSDMIEQKGSVPQSF